MNFVKAPLEELYPDHIRSECLELKKPLNERNRKTQVKINLINEYQVSREEELISELDFESENSSVYSIGDGETEKEEICMIIEKEENQPKKTPLNLQNLVQPLESKIKTYNMWKDLQIIIKGKISKEEENNSNSKEIKELISPVKTTIQTIEQVNNANKVKSIIFPTTIKLKTIELKVDTMLDTRASKNL